MSTRSLIGILTGENKDKIEYIYCHFDGYLEGVGETLGNEYRDIEKVKQLIALGDLSCLAEKVNPDPDKPHSFDGQYDGTGVQEDVCIAYGRDRGETGVGPKTCLLSDYESEADYCGAKFIYYFDPSENDWKFNTLSDDGYHDLLTDKQATEMGCSRGNCN